MLKVVSINLWLSFFFASTLHAQVEQKKIDFNLQVTDLMKGNIHYYFKILSPEKMIKNHPELLDLDSLGLLKNKDIKTVLSKTVFVIKRPIGFFDDKQLSLNSYLSHVYGENRPQGQAYFDADDVTTIPNRKVSRAFSAAKSLDIISQGASLLHFQEFSRPLGPGVLGQVAVTSYIALKEDKTLVIQYKLSSHRENLADEKEQKRKVISEANNFKRKTESYREP